MVEDVTNRQVYNSFGKVLTSGSLLWERSSDVWMEMGGGKYYTSYNGYYNKKVLYRLDIYLHQDANDESKYVKSQISLYLQGSNQKVARWVIESDDIKNNSVFENLMANLNIRRIDTPYETRDTFVVRKEQVRLTKRPSTEALLVVEPQPSRDTGRAVEYQVAAVIRDLSGGKSDKKILARKNQQGGPLNFDQALSVLYQKISKFLNYGFVDDTSPVRIPAGVTVQNWDFNRGNWIDAPSVPVGSGVSMDNNEDDEDDDIQGEEMLQLGSKNTSYVTAQDFDGYFTGDVPESAVGMLGSSAVDASQINSMFSKAGDAVNLVNRFDSSLLSNISFIFNFSKSGAYGVYLSELDRAIKTKALERKLEGEGYRVESGEGGVLTAYPTREEKSTEEIQEDIDRLYGDLDSQGGTAFGINMSAVLNAAKQDAMQSGSDSPDIWEWMALLHLGGTIVHEAVHAKGNHSEGPSESAEDKFIGWALPIINDEYKKSLEAQNRGDEFSPLTVGNETRSANRNGWYKTAEMSYYVPRSFTGGATGSDLDGRHSLSLPYEAGRAPWGMMMQQDQGVPIEKRLGRQNMSPLPEGLSQEHDSYEEQLRKYTVNDKVLDTKATIEELLSEGYDEDRGYNTIEGLLDETRVKPMMVPINRSASARMKKVALFGWMNNLEVSDGSTIPGLSDRVMAWDDRDESFSGEESDIKSQPRYNPSYDVRGFYYRYIEPRFQPQLWTDMVSDSPGVHPAKRFASKIDSSAIDILRILGIVKNKIKNNDIKSTRLLMTEDVVPILDRVFKGSNLDIEIFDTGDYEDEESIFSVWICSPGVDFEDVERAEHFLSGFSDEGESVAEKLLGLQKQKSMSIKNIMDELRNICREYGIKDFYAVGGYPRDLAMGSSPSVVEDLDFSASWPSQAVKVGGILAERLGVKDVELFHRTMTLSFCYKGIKLDFKGNFSPLEVRGGLREMGIPTTPLNMDVYNRDFTINMMVYDILSNKIYDVSGVSKEDLDGEIIKTFFAPDYVCKQNPIIILRALKFKIRYGFEIDPLLEMAMKKNSDLLFSGRYTDDRLRIARDNVIKEGRKQANQLFKEFGLEKIKEI